MRGRGRWSRKARYLRVRSGVVERVVPWHTMAHHQKPVAPPRVLMPDTTSDSADRADAADSAGTHELDPPQRPLRWAITRGQLLLLLAVFLPAVASMLAPIITDDIAYQVQTGRLMLDAGAIIDRDPFTFTALGEPWVNQQWGAGVIFAAVFDTTGWTGLLLFRAVLIGLAFGLVYLACRATDASQVVAALVTLGSFVVAATNLALRSQTFAVVFFAAVIAILAWRRKHPLLLWLIPLIMIAWGNTHGSFFIGWAAIGLAALEDLVARSHLAAVTVSVGILSVLVTLIHPWGLEMWAYVIELSTNPLIASLITEWQAATLQTPTGIFFFASVAAVVGLLLVRGRVISWLQIAWLAALALLGLMAVRNVIWWAIGAAPIVAILSSGLEVRGRRLGDTAFDRPRGIGYTAIAAVALLLGLVALPVWKPSDPLYGSADVVRDAPRGATEVLLADATQDDRLFAEQKWGSWFEMAVPGVPVMVDTRIELFDSGVWGDYLHVVGGRADWADILDRRGVTLVAVSAADEQLVPFIDVHPGWELLHRDEESVLYRRIGAKPGAPGVSE